MKRYILTILSLFCLVPLQAQSGAENLLQKTVARLQKDGGIQITMDAQIRYDHGTDRTDMELKMSDGCFMAKEDEFILWFDGKTMWNAKDYGSGIEEIYITNPTPEEKARYDIINLLGKHQGFSVSGNGTDTFILTASASAHSIEGIRKITVKVDPSTAVPQTLQIEFDDQLGNISASVQITGYKPGQKYDKSTFTCPVKDYKDAEIIDLR